MSNPAPIPCAHCGTNFMRRDLDPDAPKLCNNCIVKDQIRNPKGETKMSKVQLLVECDRATQIEIEELCTNRGISISAYLIGFHERSQEPVDNLGGVHLTQEMKDFHNEFEGKAQFEPAKVVQKKSRGAKK